MDLTSDNQLFYKSSRCPPYLLPLLISKPTPHHHSTLMASATTSRPTRKTTRERTATRRAANSHGDAASSFSTAKGAASSDPEPFELREARWCAAAEKKDVLLQLPTKKTSTYVKHNGKTKFDGFYVRESNDSSPPLEVQPRKKPKTKQTKEKEPLPAQDQVILQPSSSSSFSPSPSPPKRASKRTQRKDQESVASSPSKPVSELGPRSKQQPDKLVSPDDSDVEDQPEIQSLVENPDLPKLPLRQTTLSFGGQSLAEALVPATVPK